MDGTTKDAMRDGRLFRPASLSYALENFPLIIQEMARKKVSVIPIAAADGTYEVVVSLKNGRRLSLRREDYDKCVSILIKLRNQLPFPSDPRSYIEQARLLVGVEFSDRSAF